MLLALFAIATEPAMRYLSRLFELLDEKVQVVEKNFTEGMTDPDSYENG